MLASYGRVRAALIAVTAFASSAAVPPHAFAKPAALQTAGPASDGRAVDAGNLPVDILSDTQGVDFKPYVTGLLKQINAQWVQNMPEQARSPKLEKGETVIRCTIKPDGTLAAMKLEGRAPDDALNRAAWGAITGTSGFPPLPKAFSGPELVLRIRFLVNMPASTT